MTTLGSSEGKQLDKALALTKAQLQLAIALVNDVMKHDSRALAPEVLGAVVQALATNYEHPPTQGL